jgi:SAM-dependent methyltransferase
MKTIVSVQEIAEFDIKPPAALAQWHSMVDAELARRFKDRSGWVEAAWPTCTRAQMKPAFEHSGIHYVESETCGSIFALERPGEEEIRAWYRDSEPAKFWREKVLPASEEARREKITRPRADWIMDGIAEYAPSARRLVDVSTHGRALTNLLAEEQAGLTSIVAAGITADLEGALHAKVKAQSAPTRDLANLGPADVVVAIDALDRASDPALFLQTMGKLVAPGGILFLTAAVASGFEIQTLWGKSPSINPPDKLNLPTVDALQKFFPAPGWEILELSTPGMFDVEMVRRAIEKEKDGPWPRVVRSLVENTDETGRTALVELLQARRLASFARLIARRL